MPYPTFNIVTSPSPVLHFGSKAAFLHDLRDPRIYPTPLMLHSSSFMVAETQKGLDLRRRPIRVTSLGFRKTRRGEHDQHCDPEQVRCTPPDHFSLRRSVAFFNWRTFNWLQTRYCVSLLNRLSVRSAEPRRAAVFTAFFVLLALILCGYAITGNLRGAWRGIGVPSMAPAFADLRSVTHSIDCVEQGRDPYVDWGCDPWGRPFNQPPVWLALGKLGINSSWTNVLGFSLILAVFASFYLLLGTRTLLSGILAFAAMLSPSILLGLERGNGDLVVFTLLVLGMHALLRSPAVVRLPLVSILIASLTVLKFFPVAATLALARGWRGWATAAAVAVFSVSVFIVAVDGHLHQIFMNTPQSFYLSFGSGTLFFRAARHVGRP